MQSQEKDGSESVAVPEGLNVEPTYLQHLVLTRFLIRLELPLLIKTAYSLSSCPQVLVTSAYFTGTASLLSLILLSLSLPDGPLPLLPPGPG